MNTKEKKALMPKLRFPEFRETGEWSCEKIDHLVDTVTPPKKLSTSSYGLVGKFPIIDQSQSEVCGWTDDSDALVHEGLPLIIFGDHTCALKFVSQPFAQGADGIKILKSRAKIAASYLYQYLNYQPVVTEEYKRHYSILKEKLVLFPQHKTGEQQRIADCLSSLDELIAAQARKVEALKTHKKGLMQQLFPREGETQPRLRFPEFRGATLQSVFLGGVTEEGRSRNGNKHSSALVMGVNKSDGIVPMEARLIATDIARYKLVERDWFAYNPMRLNIGSIARWKGEREILVSPDYVVFKCITNGEPSIVPDYLDHFRHTETWNSFVKESGDGSVRVRIYYKDIAHIGLALPSPSEQQKIANCLTSLHTLITTATLELETLKTHKKGLMQQLFPSLEVGKA